MPSIAVNVQGYVYDFQISDKDTIQGLVTALVKNQLVNKRTPSHFIQVIPENGLCYQERTKIIDLIRQHIKMLFVRCAKVQGLQLNNEYFFKGAKYIEEGKRNAQNMLKVRQQQIDKMNQKLKAMHSLHQAAVDEYHKMKKKNTQLQTKLKELQNKEKQQAVYAKNSYSQSQVYKLKEELLQAKKRQQKLSKQNYQMKSKINQLQQNIKMSKISVPSHNSNVAANNSGIRNSQKMSQVSNIEKNKNLGSSQKVVLQQQEYIVETRTTNPNKKQTGASKLGVQSNHQGTSKIGQQSKIHEVKSNPPTINKVNSATKIPNYSNVYSQQSPPLKKQQSKKSDISDRSNQGVASSYSPYTSQLRSSQSNCILNSYGKSETRDKTNYDKYLYQKQNTHSNKEKQKQKGQNGKKY